MGKIYQVIVLGMKGEKLSIDVAQSEKEFNETTVLILKRKVLERIPGAELGNEPEELRLLFANKQLEDEKILSHYEIRDKSSIMLVVRLPGGTGAQ
uniref:Ubiquitin-like domain-containing protein n=1 Tax=Latimeria chalumnae TaxID=7897 RepID=H3A189_LATCH